MNTPGQAHLKAAVRAHTKPRLPTPARRRGGRRKQPRPSHLLVLATATSDDTSQSLLFGVYRALDRSGELVDEGIFHPDGLTDADLVTLRDYCAAEKDRVGEDDANTLVGRSEFVKAVLARIAFQVNGLVIGFSLPFEISRLAVSWAKARATFYAGGFSFALQDYVDEKGHRRLDRFTPRLAVKPIDSKRSLIGSTSIWRKEQAKGAGKPRRRGRFVDVRSLAFALTDDDLSVEEACKRFSVEVPVPAAPHKVSAEAIQALRQRAVATEQLYLSLDAMLSAISAAMPPESAYSAASIGKGYLKAMGVSVPSIRASPALGLSEDQLNGLAMASYYGGRAECRIRRVPVPVAYYDFRSMYPTVSSLMGLWDLLSAEEICAEDATQDVIRLLDDACSEVFFAPEAWKDLCVLVEVAPSGDILPIRSKFGKVERYTYTIGLNHVSSPYPVVYTLADCIASKILTGRPPSVLRAIRFRPVGRQQLRQVRLGGLTDYGPLREDFFRRLVEARYLAGSQDHPELQARERLVRFLKVLANSTSYGVFVQLDQQEGQPVEIDVYGLGSFCSRTARPEMPAEFYAPITATFTTAGARLMLALAENEVNRRGGTYAFMDTDSIAIVSTPEGGLVHCPGGNETLPGGGKGVRALSWAEVEEIAAKFASLNPYDPSLVPGSILELEDENFQVGNDGSRARVELMAYVVAAKRYVLYTRHGSELTIHKASEHALGAYVPPTDPTTGRQIDEWIAEAWLRILRADLGLPQSPEPLWLSQLALRTMRITAPWMMKWFEPYNEVLSRKTLRLRQRRDSRVKPFNLFEHVVPAASTGMRSAESDRRQLCLVRPMSNGARPDERWVDIHNPSGPTYRVVASGRESIDETTVIGETYADLIRKHPLQGEPKSNGADGRPCGPHTRGLLSRRRVWVSDIVHIGKEANDLELIQAGLVSNEDEHLNTYEQDLRELLPPILKLIPVSQIMEATGCSRRIAFYWRSGKHKPRRRQLNRLLPLAGRTASEQLKRAGELNVPADDRLAIRRLAHSLQVKPLAE